MPTPVKVIAELTNWKIDEINREVLGTIDNSTRPDVYVNGSEYAIINYQNATHYKDNTYSEGYWLIRTQIGNYFKLYETQRK
jgi:hypothetical protein